MQWFVESMMPEAERVEPRNCSPDAESWSEQTFKTRLFDQLIANVDRHLNNILVTKEFNLRLVDHSRAFRINKGLRDPDSLQRFSGRSSKASRSWRKRTCKSAWANYLQSAVQIDRMLNRRDAILALADKAREGKGRGRVLYK